MGKQLEALLARVQREAPRRTHATTAAKRIARLHGFALPPDLRALLRTVDNHKTENFESGDTTDLSTCWEMYGAKDILAPDGDRPFEAAVRYDRGHFTNGFGLLQLVVPMVPVLQLSRSDALFVGLSGSNPVVLLPEDALFDIGASELFFAGTSLEAVAARLQKGGVGAVLDAVQYGREHATRLRYLKVVPFVSLLVGTDDDLDLDLFEELFGLTDHRTRNAPPARPPLDAWEAFYELSRAYFFGPPEACATYAVTCRRSKLPIVKDMGRAYGELAAGKSRLGGVRMTQIRAALQDAGWGVRDLRDRRQP